MVKFIRQLVSLLALATASAALPTEDSLLQSRDVTCRDDLPGDTIAKTSEAVECIDFLASLGSQACVATISGQSFCRRGQTQITGISRVQGGNTESTCQNVARGAGQILDRCSRADGTVRGANEAWGNGNLLVDIRRVP